MPRREHARVIGSVLVLGLAPVIRAAGIHDTRQVLDARMHHLRFGAQREWDEFPERAEGAEWSWHFTSKANAAEQSLRLRQRDVKDVWQVRLNGQLLGSLVQDENEMVLYYALPPGALRDGANELKIAHAAASASNPPS